LRQAVCCENGLNTACAVKIKLDFGGVKMNSQNEPIKMICPKGSTICFKPADKQSEDSTVDWLAYCKDCKENHLFNECLPYKEEAQ